MCNPPSKIIDAKISKRQEVQKEKHKRQKETHHRRIVGDGNCNCLSETINKTSFGKIYRIPKIVRIPAFARAN